mgnify:CR=1 FL=1
MPALLRICRTWQCMRDGTASAAGAGGLGQAHDHWFSRKYIRLTEVYAGQGASPAGAGTWLFSDGCINSLLGAFCWLSS